MGQDIRKNQGLNQPQDKNRQTPTGGMGSTTGGMGGQKTPHAPGAGTDKRHDSQLGNRDKNQGQINR